MLALPFPIHQKCGRAEISGGHTTGLTDSSGNLTQSYLYGPFGELLNSPTDSNPFQYTGRENDGDGLLYYRARYYCPAWGRFLSSDPAGSEINPFVYAGDNPVNLADPSGCVALSPSEQAKLPFDAYGRPQTLTGVGIRLRQDAEGIWSWIVWGGQHAVAGVVSFGTAIFGAPDEPPNGGQPSRHLVNPKDLPLPPGITSNKQFGEFIKWGNGLADAEARTQDITLKEIEQLEKDGLTAETAKAWADYYEYEWQKAGNAVARARAALMRKIYTGIVAG